MTNTYRIAEQNIAVTSLYEQVHLLCSDYLSSGGPADLRAVSSQADIDLERERSAREEAIEGASPRRHSDAYLETLAIYRKIAEWMPCRDTVLMHGSCVAVDGAAYLFTAKSGTGKSTHTRLWRELLGARAVMVNDDKPLIRVRTDGATAFGTPWDGKHRLSSNVAVPLRAVCVLERAEENTIRAVSAAEVYPMLLQQIYRPMDGAALRKTLALIDRLPQTVRFWRLGCRPDIEAAEIAWQAMKP